MKKLKLFFTNIIDFIKPTISFNIKMSTKFDKTLLEFYDIDFEPIYEDESKKEMQFFLYANDEVSITYEIENKIKKILKQKYFFSWFYNYTIFVCSETEFEKLKSKRQKVLEKLRLLAAEQYWITNNLM